MAHSCGIDLTLDDFQRVSDRTPLLADLKPSGRFVMEDLHKVASCYPPKRGPFLRCQTGLD